MSVDPSRTHSLTDLEKTEGFELLIKPLQRLVQERGFTFATEPQKRAVPLILQGKNVLLIAPTATGKTEAAILPILNDFLKTAEKPQGIKIIYITPLRALNRDLLDRLQWWCKRLDIKVAVRHGDTDVSERSRQARSPPDLLITTPETLQAILPGRLLRKHLQAVKWVVIDEVHELAGEKRGSQLTLGLERLRWITMRDFQTIGLSATIGTPDKVAKFLVGSERECEIVKVPLARDIKLEILYEKPEKRDYRLSAKLYTHAEVAGRLRVIKNLFEKHSSVLLFTNTRSVAEVLASRFKVWDVDFPVSIHHGSLSKPSRIMAEKGLKEGQLRGLVCTSSLELGIDVGRIDLVVQYNSPRQVTRLLQRVGRSGHSIGKIPKGVVITLDSDDTFEACAISRRSMKEDLEPVIVPDKPLDALTHQLVGLLTMRSRWHYLEILEVFRKASPYKNLSLEDLESVATYMHSRFPRLAWTSIKDQVLLRSQRSKSMYDYYFSNLSMIPDEKQFLVVEEKSDTPVGVLDEAFVAEYGNPGVKFIVRGSAWKIRSVYGDKIYVQSVDDPTGAIPSWVGEEIPVPFEIALEVGQIRALIESRLDKGKKKEEIARELSKRYPASKKVFLEAVKETVEQWEKGLPIPTDKRITVEDWKEYIILQCSFGSLVNKTLSRIIGHVLSESLGQVIGVQEDPYRIVIRTEGKADASYVIKLLYDLAQADVRQLSIDAVVKTGLFKRRLIHVARKFGAISKWADYSSINMKKLVDGFKDTAIFEEAIKDTVRTDMDIDNTLQVINAARTGAIEVEAIRESRTASPVARIGIQRIGRKTDLIPPEKMRSLLIESTRVRIINEAGVFACTNCWKYITTTRIRELPEILSCPECGSLEVGMTKESEETVRKIAERKHKSFKGRESRVFEYLKGSAALIARYGSTAALALSGHNLRPGDVEEFLKEEHEENESFFERIIEVEKEALKRRFE